MGGTTLTTNLLLISLAVLHVALSWRMPEDVYSTQDKKVSSSEGVAKKLDKLDEDLGLVNEDILDIQSDQSFDDETALNLDIMLDDVDYLLDEVEDAISLEEKGMDIRTDVGDIKIDTSYLADDVHSLAKHLQEGRAQAKVKDTRRLEEDLAVLKEDVDDAKMMARRLKKAEKRRRLGNNEKEKEKSNARKPKPAEQQNYNWYYDIMYGDEPMDGSHNDNSIREINTSPDKFETDQPTGIDIDSNAFVDPVEPPLNPDVDPTMQPTQLPFPRYTLEPDTYNSNVDPLEPNVDAMQPFASPLEPIVDPPEPLEIYVGPLDPIVDPPDAYVDSNEPGVEPREQLEPFAGALEPIVDPPEPTEPFLDPMEPNMDPIRPGVDSIGSNVDTLGPSINEPNVDPLVDPIYREKPYVPDTTVVIDPYYIARDPPSRRSDNDISSNTNKYDLRRLPPDDYNIARDPPRRLSDNDYSPNTDRYDPTSRPEDVDRTLDSVWSEPQPADPVPPSFPRNGYDPEFDRRRNSNYPTRDEPNTGQNLPRSLLRDTDSRDYRSGTDRNEVVEPNNGMESNGGDANKTTFYDPQFFNTWPLRQYLGDCEDCMVKEESYSCPLDEPAREMQRWASELQELLSAGCQKPKMCDEPGRCCLDDRPEFRNLIVQVTQMMKDLKGLLALECMDCSVDCGWSEWSVWSQCDVTCGTGTRERSRTKDNPVRRGSGRQCKGPAVEVEECRGAADCCVDGNWGSWGPWSQCPVSCGRGRVERQRQCDNPPANDCGLPCEGADSEAKSCDTYQECAVDGGWSSWAPWSLCSVTCGRGRIVRRRECDNPRPNDEGLLCEGDESEVRLCDTYLDCPVTANWGSWGAWSECSVSCGRGRTERRRQCGSSSPNEVGVPCEGVDSEARACDTFTECPANWGSWEAWSDCSVTCGYGRIERRRSCDSPPGGDGQLPCEGAESEARACDTRRDCCDSVDGQWGTWQDWSTCSVSCGGGVRLRLRECDSPAPNECGRTCYGWAEERDYCNYFDCPGPEDLLEVDRCYPRDGAWSSWLDWSQCSATCGGGVRSRSRECDDPAPNACGEACAGRDYESDGCSLFDCPRPDGTSSLEGGWLDEDSCVDGGYAPWSSWSECSVTCGLGLRERSRLCDSPRPNFCGKDCEGDDFHVQSCDMGSCDAMDRTCEPAQWLSWSPWSPCPKSCGYATVSRLRQCSNPNPLSPFCDCQGPDREDREMLCGPLEEIGQWATWETWSPCSESCGLGQQIRRRVCAIEMVNPCALPCPGSDLEERMCELGECSQTCEKSWTDWAEWSSCSATCGEARRQRTRVCLTVREGEDCDDVKCPGPDLDTEECGLEPCSFWTEWTPCSASCNGVGRREREMIQHDNEGRETGLITAREVQTCMVDGTPCPVPQWSAWAEWCPCNCHTGLQNRVRKCQEPETGKQRPLNMCQGVARENKTCDVSIECPHCITTCKGLMNGKYPACTGCDDYIKCDGGLATIYKCKEGRFEWDAFTETCNKPPSPSCMLKESVMDCRNNLDGKYHSASGCDEYVLCQGGKMTELTCDPGQEWNQNRQRCESGKSLTCARRLGELDIDFGPDEERKAEVTGEFMDSLVSDAPADDYYDERHNLSPEDARKQYQAKMELEKELANQIAADFRREYGEGFDFSSLFRPRVPEVPDCVMSCKGQDAGIFPSCRDCRHYVICDDFGGFRERLCERRKQFDNITKTCQERSSTCKTLN